MKSRDLSHKDKMKEKVQDINSLDGAMGHPGSMSYLGALPLWDQHNQQVESFIQNFASPKALLKPGREGLTYIVPFTGSGLFSMAVKGQKNCRLICNEVSDLYYPIQGGLISNSSIVLTEPDLQTLLKPLPEDGPVPVGFIGIHLFLDRQEADLIERILGNAPKLLSPTKEDLAYVLCWRLFIRFVKAIRSYDKTKKAPEGAMEHLPHQLYLATCIGMLSRETDDTCPLAEVSEGDPLYQIVNAERLTINQGIFKGESDVFCCRHEDPVKFIASMTGDILYLDLPQSGSLNYDARNYPFEAIIQQDHVADYDRFYNIDAFSAYLQAILDHARHIPEIIINYGDRPGIESAVAKAIQRVMPGASIIPQKRSYWHHSSLCTSPQKTEYLIHFHNRNAGSMKNRSVG